MAPCGQNSGVSVSLRYSKRKPNLKALFDPILLSSSTMTAPFIPFLIRKLQTPIVVSWVILLRYIHAFLFSALISISLDVRIMTCCHRLLWFHPQITSSKPSCSISPSSCLEGCSSTRVSVCCSVSSLSLLWPVGAVPSE